MSDEIFSDLGDLSGASTTYPVLPAQAYTLIVKDCQVVDKKDDAMKKNLIVTLATTQAEKDVNGNDSNTGLEMRQYIGLSETEKRKKTNIQSDLAKLMQCFLGHHDGAFKPDSLVGQTGLVKLKVEHSDEYGDKNSVATYVPKK